MKKDFSTNRVKSLEENISRFLEFMENEIWPNVQNALLGKRLKRDEDDQILGYGKDGICSTKHRL